MAGEDRVAAVGNENSFSRGIGLMIGGILIASLMVVGVGLSLFQELRQRRSRGVLHTGLLPSHVGEVQRAQLAPAVAMGVNGVVNPPDSAAPNAIRVPPTAATAWTTSSPPPAYPFATPRISINAPALTSCATKNGALRQRTPDCDWNDCPRIKANKYISHENVRASNQTGYQSRPRDVIERIDSLQSGPWTSRRDTRTYIEEKTVSTMPNLIPAITHTSADGQGSMETPRKPEKAVIKDVDHIDELSQSDTESCPREDITEEKDDSERKRVSKRYIESDQCNVWAGNKVELASAPEIAISNESIIYANPWLS